ncbi:MAG: LysM peptidoglycan-binding domain-containing protein [Solirubrobacteraceae bacterium]
MSQSGGAATQANVPPHGTYAVRPGDSLWSIAQRLLQARGHTPTAAAVARVVHRLWDTNSARIRSGDADLIEPGTRLVLPRA